MSETTDRDAQNDDERTVVVFHGSRRMYLVNTTIGIITIIAMLAFLIVHLL